MKEVNFEYYILNYNFNRKKVENWNIFNNSYIYKWTLKAVKKYVRSPKKYKYIKVYANPFLDREEEAIYGFEGLCKEIRSIIQHELWARCEYEISVGDSFIADAHDFIKTLDKNSDYTIEDVRKDLELECRRNTPLEKWDGYDQAFMNIPMIARECIYRYKQSLKEEKANE